MAITKGSIVIDSLELWAEHAGPKSVRQWVDGRSAKETARAWLDVKGSSLPSEIEALLSVHQAFGPVLRWDAEPEARLRFDDFAGEPRNSDMVVRAEDSDGRYLIAVEAKADEPFGDTVADTLGTAVDRYLANRASNGVARVQQLAVTLFGARGKGEPPLKDIRYQLLTACAGAICEASRHGYSRCLMLVHEFITNETTDRKHQQNAKDLNRFIKRLSHGAKSEIHTGEICGPFQVPGEPLLPGSTNIFLGKVSRNVRSD